MDTDMTIAIIAIIVVMFIVYIFAPQKATYSNNPNITIAGKNNLKSCRLKGFNTKTYHNVATSSKAPTTKRGKIRSRSRSQNPQSDTTDNNNNNNNELIDRETEGAQ